MPAFPLSIWIAGIVAALLIGFAKGGFSGLGMLATPVLALAMPPGEAAAAVLPVLIVQDVISVWTFRRDWDGWIIAWMLPGALVGIILGYLFAASMDEHALTLAIGLLTLGFGCYRLWIERGGRVAAPSNSPGWVGTLFGVMCGLTSQISHAGSPAFQIWVTPRQLPHLRYAGTTAVLFACMNWLKVPSYLALGVIHARVLQLAALVMPVAIISTIVAIRLMYRIDPSRYYRVIYLLMVLIGAKLIWDGLVR